jgi:chromosome partitioning protein
MDTQSNSSIWLLRLEKWNRINMSNRDSIYSIFVPGEQRVSDIVVKDAVRDQGGKVLLPGLDLLPTTFNFIDLENEYVPDPYNPHFVIFRDQLREIEGDYDYVLFDCPPNFLRATQLSVFASNEMIVPSNPDALSLIGFTLMVEKLMLFHKRSARFRDENMGRPAYVRGIAFNAIKANVDISVSVMRMQMRLKQFIRQRFVSPDAKVFARRIRDATIVRRAVSLGIPVNVVSGQDTQQGIANDFRGLAEEIEGHVPDESAPSQTEGPSPRADGETSPAPRRHETPTGTPEAARVSE